MMFDIQTGKILDISRGSIIFFLAINIFRAPLLKDILRKITIFPYFMKEGYNLFS